MKGVRIGCEESKGCWDRGKATCVCVCACSPHHHHFSNKQANKQANKQTNKQASKQTNKQATDLLSVSKPPLKPVKPFRGTRLPSKPRNLSNSCDPVGLDSIASSVDCEAAQYMTPNL